MIVDINMVIKICKECFGSQRMTQFNIERKYDNFFGKSIKKKESQFMICWQMIFSQ